MKVIVHGPAAGPGPDGMITSWAPDQDVEVDDGDRQAVAWARSFIASGMATLVEDVAAKAPARQEKPAAAAQPRR